MIIYVVIKEKNLGWGTRIDNYPRFISCETYEVLGDAKRDAQEFTNVATPKYHKGKWVYDASFEIATIYKKGIAQMNRLKQDIDRKKSLLVKGDPKVFILEWVEYLSDNRNLPESELVHRMWFYYFNNSSGGVSCCNNKTLLLEEYDNGTLEDLYEKLPTQVLLRRYEIEWGEGINK